METALWFLDRSLRLPPRALRLQNESRCRFINERIEQGGDTGDTDAAEVPFTSPGEIVGTKKQGPTVRSHCAALVQHEPMLLPPGEDSILLATVRTAKPVSFPALWVPHLNSDICYCALYGVEVVVAQSHDLANVLGNGAPMPIQAGQSISLIQLLYVPVSPDMLSSCVGMRMNLTGQVRGCMAARTDLGNASSHSCDADDPFLVALLDDARFVS